MADTPDNPMIGREIGGYVLERMLGKGGMGAVYFARHKTLGKPAAVKILSAALMDENARRRFLREARSAASLDHPNAVQVFDHGTSGDLSYIVMHFVEGESASGRIKRQGALPVLEALNITIDAARGLQAAHRLGIIHRDIKPDNIMIDKDGTVKVADFGLAKELDKEESLTISYQAMGTPNYMSPEQARDAKTVSYPTDIYSLGATLFSLASGRPPFTGSTPWAVVTAAMTEPTPDVRTVKPDVPASVAEFLLRMMAKDPKARPEDMGAVLEGLLDIKRNLEKPDTQSAPPPAPLRASIPFQSFPTPATAVPRRARSALLIPAALAGLAAVVITLAILFIPNPRAGDSGNNGPGDGPSGEPGPAVENPPEAGPPARPDLPPDPEPKVEPPPTKPEPADKAEPAKTEPAEPAQDDRALEAFGEVRAGSKVALSQGRYADALKALDAFLAEFGATRARDSANREIARVLAAAQKAFEAAADGIAKDAGEERFEQALAASTETLAAIAEIRGVRAVLPEGLEKVRVRVEEARAAASSLVEEIRWLDALEPRLASLQEAEARETANRLALLGKSPSPRVSGRATGMQEKFLALADARRAGAETAAFRKAMQAAKSRMDSADPGGASALVEPFASSRTEAVRKEAVEAMQAARELKKELDRFDESRRRIETRLASERIAETDRAREDLRPFGVSLFPCVKGRAAELGARLESRRGELAAALAQKGFAFVSGFEGSVGSPDAADENPPKPASVKAFAIGLREVTCGEYAAFLGESGHSAPPDWPGGKPPEGWADRPVTSVSAPDAEAYAGWLGKKLNAVVRLPLEEEWEVAAGFDGSARRAYPWGDDFEEGAANLSAGEPRAAGSCPRDRSPCGALDMAGNVCEWTRRASGGYAIRGGCFDDDSPRPARCVFRQDSPEDVREPTLGFRVVMEDP